MGAFYCCFQTQNANIDSWYYAACVKHGEELINSHHLLYNGIGRVWYLLLSLLYPSIHALTALNLMNAFAAVACLFLCYKILLRLNQDSETAFLLTMIGGATFGFMRFATDAETYILPLVFALWSVLRLLSGDKALVSAALMAGAAILVHELYIWWALSLGIYILRTRSLKTTLLKFGIPMLIVPVVYCLAFYLSDSQQGFTDFIIGRYGDHQASVSLSGAGVLLTIINMIRSVFQIHGQISFVFRQYPVASAAVFIAVSGFAIMAIRRLKYFKSGQLTREQKPVYQLFLSAFLLFTIFACLSSGNAEFMTMLPFFIIFAWTARPSVIDIPFLKYFFLVLMLWNAATGILPPALLDISRNDRQCEFTEKHRPHAAFLWCSKPLVENMLTYKEGFNVPVDYLHRDSAEVIKAIESGKTVYTDYFNTTTVFSRRGITDKHHLITLKNRFNTVVCDSFDNLWGKNYIWQMSQKVR